MFYIYSPFIKKMRSCIVYALALFCICCTSGGGTDVDTALVQGNVTSDGQTPAATVYIMRSSYNPILGDTVVPPQAVPVDSLGNYSFSVKGGIYSLAAEDSGNTRISWVTKISVDPGDIKILNFSLRPIHAIVFKLPPEQRLTDKYVYIPGNTTYGRFTANKGDSLITLGRTPEAYLPEVMIGDLNNLAIPPELFKIDIGMFSEDTLYLTI